MNWRRKYAKGWGRLGLKSDARELGSEIIIYQTEDGRTKIDVRMEDETVWLSQAQMVDLFQTSKTNISEHIRHIFDEGELLSEDSVVRNFRTTAADGKNYSTKHYNLDVIISVGYRVKSLELARCYKIIEGEYHALRLEMEATVPKLRSFSARTAQRA